MIGSVAEWVSAIVAGGALCYAVFQVRDSRQAGRELDARATHREYLSLCMQHPELSSSIMFAKKTNRSDFHGIAEELTPESESYLWFVSILLNNCEQILESIPEKEGWREILRSQLEYHRPVLLVKWKDWKNSYTPKTRKLVDEVIKDS